MGGLEFIRYQKDTAHICVNQRQLFRKEVRVAFDHGGVSKIEDDRRPCEELMGLALYVSFWHQLRASQQPVGTLLYRK